MHLSLWRNLTACLLPSPGLPAALCHLSSTHLYLKFLQEDRPLSCLDLQAEKSEWKVLE